MTERLTTDEFLASPGVGDWRVVFGGGWACAHFRTASFVIGAALVQEISVLAAAAGHYPDVDLRPNGVYVRTSSGLSGLSSRDAELARQISSAAAELNVVADPTVVQQVQVAIDALDIAAVRPFWHAVLGYAAVNDEDLVDDLRRGPTFWFQQMDSQRNRVHIDIYVPRDQVEARVAAGLAAGGQMVRDNGPDWWTLADPEGNEADLAAWG